MSSEYRAIILRNDNPNITYVGNWTPVEANIVDNVGNFGSAYSPTLQSAKSNSSFSLPFQGSSITVFATVNNTNEHSNPNPTWQCFIDGITLGTPNLVDFPENNWPLCGLSNIPDGAHELVVNVMSDGMPFYLDYIKYRSSSDVSLENSPIYIDNPDPAINYISGWSSLGETANQTTDSTSLVTATFVGVQLSWYGFIPVEEFHNASSGEYSVDGEPFTPFQLVGLPQTATVTIYNQLFFTTPVLDMDTHVLSVKYTGQPGETPLTLDYLIVTNGSLSSSSTSSSAEMQTGTHSSGPKQTSSTASPATATNSSTVQIGVGEIVGPIVGVAVIVAIIFIWFKFNRKRRQRYSANNVTPNLRQPKISPLPEDPNRYAPLPNIMSPANVVPINPFNDLTSPCTTSLLNPSHTPHASQPIATRCSNLNPIGPTSLFTTPPQSSTLTVAVVSGDSSGHPLSASAHPRIPIRHEDSGIRLPQATPSVIDEIEIHPTYTKQ